MLENTTQSIPECGKDFCDACGDCLHCYGGDKCYDTDPPSEHIWIKSVEDDKT